MSPEIDELVVHVGTTPITGIYIINAIGFNKRYTSTVTHAHIHYNNHQALWTRRTDTCRNIYRYTYANIHLRLAQ